MVTAMADELRQWLHQVIGDHSVVGSAPATARRTGTGQRVIEVVDSEETRWFAKAVAAPRGWRAEVRAYREWVPALGGSVPTLRAADPELRTLLLSSVPGRAPRVTDSRAHRQAGVVLRRLHRSRPARRQRPSDRERTSLRLSMLVDRNPGLFTSTEVEFASDRANRIKLLPLGERVPCHGDYKPHNWLVDPSGTLRVIDFGESRWAPAASDFARMFYGVWWVRPDLAAAFFAGYGRQPTRNELELVRLQLATHAFAEIAFGRNRGTPQHEDHGRSRLADLLAGHQVRAQEPWRQRLTRPVRNLHEGRTSSPDRRAG